MARRRFARRRSSWVALAAICSLVVLIFGRDVSHSAHADAGAQASENLSFATLATTTVAQEAAVDSALHQLLTQAPHLTRAALLDQLLALRSAAQAARAQVAPLTGPALVGNIAPTFVHDAQRRARAYETIATSIATSLALPWSPSHTGSTVTAFDDLTASQTSWASAAAALARLPGHAVVPTFPVDNVSALSQSLTSLTAMPNLALTRTASLVAVSFLPAPLPAAGGVINLIPLTSFQVEVAAQNTAVDRQPVTLTATLTFRDGQQQVHHAHGTIGPNNALAFQDITFAVTPGAHATLVLRLEGAPALANGFSERTYQVVVAPQ